MSAAVQGALPPDIAGAPPGTKFPKCPSCELTPCKIVPLVIGMGRVQAMAFTCYDCGAILGISLMGIEQRRVVPAISLHGDGVQ
jgi:hypothetical protein